jgi:hypothetical protein
MIGGRAVNKKNIGLVILACLFLSNFKLIQANQKTYSKNDGLALESVSLDNIKTIQESLLKENKKNKLLRRGGYVLGAVAISFMVGKIVYDLKHKANNNIEDLSADFPQELAVDYLFFRQPFSKRLIREVLLRSIIQGVGFGIVKGFSSFFVSVYNKLKEKLFVKTDSSVFYLDECSRNLRIIASSLNGLAAFDDNDSYLKFYISQIISTHNLLVFAIENVVASVVVSQKEQDESADYEWLLSEDNGLVCEFDKLTQVLQSKLVESLSVDSEFISEIEVCLHGVLLALQRLVVDFNI